MDSVRKTCPNVERRSLPIQKEIAQNSRATIVEEAVRILEKHKYTYIDNLGGGTFGDVLHVLKPNRETAIAVKVVAKDRSSRGDIHHWQKLHHPNVLPLLELMYLPNLPTFIFQMDMQQATMIQIVRSEEFRKEPDCLECIESWLRDILQGLHYMHAQKLAHLDVKTDNVLITDEQTAVLCDFTFTHSTETPVEEFGAPRHLRPPEGCLTYGSSNPVDGVAVDIWTFGLLAVNAMTGHVLSTELSKMPQSWSREIYSSLYRVLQKDNLENCIRNALQGAVIGNDTMRNIQNFVHTCLQIDPDKRPSAEQVLTHSFLKRGSHWGEVDARWTEKATPADIETMIIRFLFRQQKLKRRTMTTKVEDTDQTPVTIVASDGRKGRGWVKTNPETKSFDVVTDDGESIDASNFLVEDHSDSDSSEEYFDELTSLATNGVGVTVDEIQEDAVQSEEYFDALTSLPTNGVGVTVDEIQEDAVQSEEYFDALTSLPIIGVDNSLVADQENREPSEENIDASPSDGINVVENLPDNQVNGNRPEENIDASPSDGINVVENLPDNQVNGNRPEENIDASHSHEIEDVANVEDNQANENASAESNEASQHSERLEIPVQADFDERERILHQVGVRGTDTELRTSNRRDGNDGDMNILPENTLGTEDNRDTNGPRSRRNLRQRRFFRWILNRTRSMRYLIFRRRRGNNTTAPNNQQT